MADRMGTGLERGPRPEAPVAALAQSLMGSAVRSYDHGGELVPSSVRGGQALFAGRK